MRRFLRSRSLSGRRLHFLLVSGPQPISLGWSPVRLRRSPPPALRFTLFPVLSHPFGGGSNSCCCRCFCISAHSSSAPPCSFPYSPPALLHPQSPRPYHSPPPTKILPPPSTCHTSRLGLFSLIFHRSQHTFGDQRRIWHLHALKYLRALVDSGCRFMPSKKSFPLFSRPHCIITS